MCFKSADVILIVSIFLISGCATKAPPSQAEKLPVQAPATYNSDHDKASFWNDGWMQDIQDPLLPRIIAEALEQNYNLIIAEGRLQAAEATAVIQGSGRYPDLDLRTTGGRRLTSKEGQQFEIRSNYSSTFRLDFRTNWELDIWGRVRDQANAGYADYQASIEDYRAARFSIAGQTARAWYSAVSSEIQLDVAIDNLVTFESNLEIVEENFKRGLSRALDLHLMRANVANAQSAYEGRLRIRDADLRVLEIILGRYPALEIEAAKELPQIKSSIPVGLPDELLNRRPDIRAAERRVAADSVGIEIAKKALLPGLNLNGLLGRTASQFKDLSNEDLETWNLGYNITLPIFNGSRLTASKRRVEAVYKQSLANYAQTVLNAFEEVETVLADEDSLFRDEEALKITVEEYEAAVDLAWEQYGRGLVDIITVLDSQRRLFNAIRSLIVVSSLRIQNRIGLYLALGGGFAEDDDKFLTLK